LETRELLIACLDPQPGESILDAGCGMGASTARLAAAGADVLGIDVLPALLEQARFAHPGCRFLHADLLHFKPREPFDAILAHAVLHWIQPAVEAARRLHACLKPGGRLAASLGGVTEAARNVDGYYQPTAREYEKVLKKAGFSEIEVELIWPELNGGTLIATARRLR
jgi:trans-aconitate methyltransferase